MYCVLRDLLTVCIAVISLHQTESILWTEVTSSATWSGRYSFVSLVTNDTVWILGGLKDSYSSLNDVWYTVDGVTWTEVTSVASWSARYAHSGVVFDSKLWVIGGRDVTSRSYTSDVWYSEDGATWNSATLSAPWSARAYHTSVVYNGKMWIMGGYNGASKFSDVWYSLDGVAWTDISPVDAWQKRHAHSSVVFDNKMWIIGGKDLTSFNDVWYTADEINWIEVTSSSSWIPRHTHSSVVYNNQIWVLGGFHSDSGLGDVWYSSNGLSWFEDVSRSSWSDRYYLSSFTFQNKLWVAGGIGSTPYNDVWCAMVEAVPTDVPSGEPTSVPSELPVAGTVLTIANGAAFTQPYSVCIPLSGLYALISEYEGNKIQYLDTVSGEVRTLAGSGSHTTFDGLGSRASFKGPKGVTISSDEDFALIAERDGHSIRKVILSTSEVSTLAGTGVSGNDDGTGTLAKFNAPCSVSMSSDDSYALVADIGGHNIRHIDMLSYAVTTLVGTASPGSVDSIGTTGSFDNPSSVKISPDGSYALVVDQGNAKIRKVILETLVVSTLAGSGAQGSADGTGSLATFDSPEDITFSPNGLSALVSDNGGVKIRVIDLYTATVTTLAGSGAAESLDGVGISASFHSPRGIATHPYIEYAFVMEEVTGEIRKVFYSFFTAIPSSHPSFLPSEFVDLTVRGWQVATPDAAWSARYRHTTTIYSGKIWVMGGIGGENSVWWSDTGINWTMAVNAEWSSRYGHSSVMYDDKMWVIGGEHEGLYLNDVWYTEDGANWIEVISNAEWDSRSHHTSVVFNDKMWLLGGIGSSVMSDVWYTSNGIHWTVATEVAEWSARFLHSSVVYDNKMWVIGGQDVDYMQDVWWSTDGSFWTQASSNADWSARSAHSSVTFNDNMWVICGRFESETFSDVWYSADGVTWTLSSGSGLTARSSHTSIVYNQKIWTLGGYGVNSLRDVRYTVSMVSPSFTPTEVPSNLPSMSPTCVPTTYPSEDPSGQPSEEPSGHPSGGPSTLPSGVPSCQPLGEPSRQPSGKPSGVPSSHPSGGPSMLPSGAPSSQPFGEPSRQPSGKPSGHPSGGPSTLPSGVPSCQPLGEPSRQPSGEPSGHPSVGSSTLPSGAPSCQPSGEPSRQPSEPSGHPSGGPSTLPSGVPSRQPTDSLTSEPSIRPTGCPNGQPSLNPTTPHQLPPSRPSLLPTDHQPIPTYLPSCKPTARNSDHPNSTAPSKDPNTLPSYSPSRASSIPSGVPLSLPSPHSLTLNPTVGGETPSPSFLPSLNPINIPPNIMSCQLSSGGRYAVITFDRQSSMGDTASVFQCSKILMFNGAEKASCRWKYGSSSLWAYPSAHYYFNVSDELILVPHVLRAACPIQGGLECDEWPTAAIQSCKITSPDDPIVPIVSLSAPSTIGRCVDFELDVTGSVGSGGRKWEKITVNVTVSSTSLYTIKNLSDINYFYSYMYQISPPTRLPGAYLHTDVDYLFTVTLCNFLRQCGVNRHMLTVVNYFLPVVSIVGLPNRMTYSRHALRLTSKAYVPACAAEWSQRDLSYNWSVELNDKVQHGLVNTLEDETKFKLPGYALRVWLEYKVTVIASLDLLNVKSMASVLVNVIPSSVVAVLSGGSAQTVRLGEVIVVSGSDSYDEDVFGTTGISAGLNFSWTCFEVTTGGSCVLAVTSTVNADAFVGMADIQSSVGKTVAVKVTVFGSYNRTDTAVTYVSVLPSVSPKVALSVSTFRIRHADKAKIFANVEIPVASQALWSINDTTVDLRSIALTPVGSRFGNGSVGTFNLVIGGGNLHLGSAYAFCLTVGQSAAIITIEVMDSPIPGAFDVFPSLGYEFRDIFVMSVSQWVDSELPLTYSYGFLASDDSLLIVQPRSELSHISARLPGGFSTIQYSLTCVVTAYNIYDAKASLSHIVTVLPLFTDVINLNITIEELLEASASDVDFTWQTISVGLAMLNNNHNCSMAPNCTMLHRDACTTTDHVCGACSEGYYGEHTGHHANTECYPVSSKEMSIDDNACDEDNSCGIFGKCLDGVCLYPSKSCPLDCFGKGMCLMVRLATGEIVDTCLTNDVTCRAVCSCYSGYSGVSCGTSVAVIHAKQDVKLKLAQTAEKLIVEYSDQSEESVEAAVSLVAQLGVNLHELISESCSILERMISHLLNDAQELGMAYETVKKVFAVVDACVEIEFVHGNVNTFDQVLNQYTQLAISNMELGQENVGFIGDTIRTVLSLQPQAENSFVVDIPRSAIEISQGINKSSVRFHGTYSSRVSGSVTLVEVSQKIYSNYSALLANPIKIEVVVSDAAVGERLEFSAMMINNIAIDYNSTTGRSSSMLNDSFVNVCATGEHSVFNHTCPISGIVVTHRCLGTRQTLVSTCPRVQLVPVCREIVSGILDVDSIACKVLSYDSTYTLCSCTMEIASIRRLSDSSNEDVKRSGAMELVVMATYTYTGAVETIYQADDITIRSVVNSVLVLSFFAGLWGCGLLLIAELTRLSAIKTMTPTGGRKRSEKSVVGSLLHDTSRDKKDYLMMYIKYAIPEIFLTPGYDLKSMVVEAMRHHKISLIVFSSGRDAEEKRLLMGLYLLSIQTMLMFTLALCYDLENPEDDGTCKGYTTQATCLDERSMFDASKTMCKWVPGDSGVFVCEYRDPDFSARVIIIVSIFVSIVTAPMNLIVVFLFESILCAPSEDDHKAKLSFMSNLSRKMSHTVRRASNVIHKMSAAMEMPNMRVKKQSSILSGLITDVTRDIPDTVANAHALATSAMKSIVDRTNDDEERNFSHVTYPDNEQSLNSILRQRTLSRLSSVEESGILQQLSIVLGNTTGYALESECIQATYSDFLRAITNYRDSISDEEKVKLDKAWGWNARRCRVGNEFAAKRAILQAETICIEKISKLSSASDLEAGLEIIHLFVFDLLGRDTSAGIIFNRITEDKFKYTYVVTFYSKFLAWVAVIFLNFFFLFFIFLRASSREFAWQVGFVVACIIQLLIELILYETTEMVYIYFLIPRLVAADVAESLEALKQAVDKAYSNDSRKNESSFNSAAFFFASHQLATFFPNSFEASIVQSFSSTLPPPGMLLKPKRRLRDRHRNRFESVVKILRRFGVTAMLVAALKFIGSLPIRYQQILLHIVQPVIIGLIYLAGLMLWRNPFLFVIPGVLFMLTTVWLYLFSGKMPPVEEKLISRNLTPHNTVTPVVSCTGISEERIDVVTEEGDLRRVYPRDETDGMNKLEKKLGIEEIRNPRCTYAHPYEGKLRQGLFISNISSGENDDSSGSKAVSSFEACYDMNGSVETNNTNDQSSDACNSSTISECYDKYGKRRSNRDVYDVLISDCSSDESKESLISEECASSYSSSSSVYSDGFYSSESDTA